MARSKKSQSSPQHGPLKNAFHAGTRRLQESDSGLEVGGLPQVAITPLELKLDSQNPRLAPEERGSSQSALLEIMLRRFKIDEVAESIVSRGYIPFDPLIGWKDDDDVVIREGNRRVAALKLLLEPGLASPKFEGRWRELSRQAHGVRSTFEKVAVRLVPDPNHNEVLAYLGFRHISGNLQWSAFEKATYIADLVQNHGWSYPEVARQIGSRADAVERHYVAYRVVQVARDIAAPGANPMQSSFGVLMRALNSPGSRSFLGVTYPGDPKHSKTPIPKAKHQNLQDFTRWTFGTEDYAPVLEDSRQLTEWGRILDSPAAVAYMRNTEKPRFERALFKSGGETQSVVESLMAAADRLEEALPHVKQHKENKDVKDLVQRCAYFLQQILEHFPKVRERQDMERPNA